MAKARGKLSKAQKKRDRIQLEKLSGIKATKRDKRGEAAW